MKSALIAGASGLTGKQLLYCLLNNREYTSVFILVRKELAIKDPKLTQILFDFNNKEQYKDIPLVDEVFCCLGTTIKKAGSQEAFKKVDFEYPIQLAEACVQKGIKKFLIITALGADRNSKIFYNRTKGETEERIKSFPLNSLYFCRPSLLLGSREEIRIGEEIGKFIAKFISFFFLGPLKKYQAIEAACVSRAMIALAKENKPGIHIIESDLLQKLGKNEKH